MRSDIGGGAWSYRRPKARTRRGTFAASVLTGLAVALLATYAQSSLEHTLVETKNLYAWLIWLGVVARMRVWAPRPLGESRALAPSERVLEHCR